MANPRVSRERPAATARRALRGRRWGLAAVLAASAIGVWLVETIEIRSACFASEALSVSLAKLLIVERNVLL
jgi:hypothetical protein